MFEINKGKVQKALKVVIYGPEGIGKSTFASRFPDPLFIDTEGSTSYMDVARLPKPTSWEMLKQEIEYVKNTSSLCRTLVIDTVDWAEQLCIEHICSKHNKSGIEDFGYGNGYVYAKEEFCRFLNQLSDVIETGVNIVLTAHAQIRKFEQPDELGAYDRYELKLGKKTSSQTSPLVKEWADMVLFANYKTHSVATDKDGKKHKAQGGRRVMYTSHHPCWDAKNRQGLQEELDFDFMTIAHLFKNDVMKQDEINDPIPQNQGLQLNDNTDMPIHTIDEDVDEGDWNGIPQALVDLMKLSNVTPKQVQEAVASKHYYPIETSIKDYQKDFIDGVLIAAWPQVYDMIQNPLPF